MRNRIRKSLQLLYGVLLLCCLFSFVAMAQQPLHIKGVSDFSIDPLGNCYYRINDDIIKADRGGRELSRFSRRDLGTPTSFDVSNPLRILVFYAPFARVRILDNNLIEQSEIDLRSMGILQPKVIAGTPDQGIWIFEEISGSLLKLDTRLKSTAISVDLNQLLGRRPQPDLMIANQRWMVLKDAGEILIFDQFGTRARSLPLPGRTRMLQLNEDRLFYEENGQIIDYSLVYNIGRPTDQKCPPEAVMARTHEEKCWYLTANELVFPTLKY